MAKTRGLTRDQREEAVTRCESIVEALSLLCKEVLNGFAYVRELDEVIRIIHRVEALQIRLDSYPELAPHPDQARIRELINQGFPYGCAKAIADDESRANSDPQP